MIHQERGERPQKGNPHGSDVRSARNSNGYQPRVRSDPTRYPDSKYWVDFDDFFFHRMEPFTNQNLFY